MDFSLRRATLKDYEELCEVFAEGDALHHEALPHFFRRTEGPARSRQYLSEILANREAALFVAETAGRILGAVHAEVRRTPDLPSVIPRRYVRIAMLVVRARFRRLGVGRALLERVHRWALEQGIAQVELLVWEFNQEAIAFYEKLGYETASRLMWKSLSCP